MLTAEASQLTSDETFAVRHSALYGDPAMSALRLAAVEAVHLIAVNCDLMPDGAPDFTTGGCGLGLDFIHESIQLHTTFSDPPLPVWAPHELVVVAAIGADISAGSYHRGIQADEVAGGGRIVAGDANLCVRHEVFVPAVGSAGVLGHESLELVSAFGTDQPEPPMLHCSEDDVVAGSVVPDRVIGKAVDPVIFQSVVERVTILPQRFENAPLVL